MGLRDRQGREHAALTGRTSRPSSFRRTRTRPECRCPGTGPVDLMVYHPRDDERGDRLIVASGYKAGLIFAIFPKASIHPERLGLSVDWLIENWHDWFQFTYHRDQPIPVTKARVLRVDARTISEEV